MWGRTAEIAGQYLTKGQEIYVEGRIETRSYNGKDGVERRTTEIVVENMQMGSRPQGSGNYARPAAAAVAGGAAVAASKNEPVAEEIPTINLDDEQDEVKIEDVPF